MNSRHRQCILSLFSTTPDGYISLLWTSQKEMEDFVPKLEAPAWSCNRSPLFFYRSESAAFGSEVHAQKLPSEGNVMIGFKCDLCHFVSGTNWLQKRYTSTFYLVIITRKNQIFINENIFSFTNRSPFIASWSEELKNQRPDIEPCWSRGRRSLKRCRMRWGRRQRQRGAEYVARLDALICEFFVPDSLNDWPVADCHEMQPDSFPQDGSSRLCFHQRALVPLTWGLPVTKNWTRT